MTTVNKLRKKMGRPTLFKPEYVEQAVKLAGLGATDEDLADFFHVNQDTINEWKKKHPDFSESLKKAKDELDRKVVHSLFERATGYKAPDTYFSSYEGVVTATPYIKHYPPDPVSMIFWLKNRQPKRWRDQQQVEHSGNIEVTGLPADVLARLREMSNRAAIEAGKLIELGSEKGQA